MVLCCKTGILNIRTKKCRHTRLTIVFSLIVATYVLIVTIANTYSKQHSYISRTGEKWEDFDPSQQEENVEVHVPQPVHNTPPPTSQPSSPCQVIHIGMRSDTAEDTRGVVAIIKQLLYFGPPSSVFGLHVSASSTSKVTLTTLMTTWELDRVAILFYPLAGPRLYDAVPVILSRIPKSVHQLLFIDSKMRLVRGVAELWDAVTKNQTSVGKHFVGAVRSARAKARRDCVVCVHDVLAMSVQSARRMFPELLSIAANENILAHLQHYHVFPLPPAWFVELDPDFPYDSAIQSADDIAAYRLSSQATSFIANQHVTGARELGKQVELMNGDILGHRRHPCTAPGAQAVTKMPLPVKASCKEFRLNAQLLRRVHLYYIGSPLTSSGQYDVSMLTQFTLDRLPAFELLASRWLGPLHALLYADDREADKLMRLVAASKALVQRKNLAFHVVYRRTAYYPINFLRNVLVNVSSTPYLLFNDVDLVPSEHMYAHLLKHIEQHMPNTNTTLVIPAFEILNKGVRVPTNRTQLLQTLDAGTIIGYRMNKGWNVGHKATNYPKWKQAEQPYFVPYSGAFEPYVVLASRSAPLYDERLLERMGDKIAYGVELLARGYKFLILDDCFIVHMPHPPSEGTEVWKSSRDYSRCAGLLNKEHKTELRVKHPNVNIP